MQTWLAAPTSTLHCGQLSPSKILCDELIRNALREGIKKTQLAYPFEIDAWVLLPDHLHCLWTLPEGESNFPVRWGRIKRHVSLVCGDQYKRMEWLSVSKKKHRESTLWQRRYWEHQIRDQDNFNRHVDYIHFNPVKHGLWDNAIQWPYSTLRRYLKGGSYPLNWVADEICDGGVGYGE